MDPQDNEENQSYFVEQLPVEIIHKIFIMLDIKSLCNASLTCKGWNKIVKSSDFLWEKHCLALKSVCPREIDHDIKKALSWKEILLKNYTMSKVKHEWLSGKYSNIRSPDDLSKVRMCEMDADTWGEILEKEELRRNVNTAIRKDLEIKVETLSLSSSNRGTL